MRCHWFGLLVVDSFLVCDRGIYLEVSNIRQGLEMGPTIPQKPTLKKKIKNEHGPILYNRPTSNQF